LLRFSACLIANLNPSLTGWANSSNDSEVISQRNNNISFKIEDTKQSSQPQVQAIMPLEKIQDQEPSNIQTPTTIEKSALSPLEDLLTSNENSPTMVKEKKRVMLTKVAEESLFKRLSTPKKAAPKVKKESTKLQAHSVLESKRTVSTLKSIKKIMKLPDTCRNFVPVAKNVAGLSETPLSELQSHLKPKPVETLGIVFPNKEYKPVHTFRVTKVKSIHASASVDENREKKRKVPANFRFNEPTEILAASSSSESPKNAQRNSNSRTGKRITLYKDIFWSKTALKSHNLEVSTSEDFTDKILDFIEAHPQESKLFLQSPGSLVEAQTFDFTSAQKKQESQSVKLLPMPRFKSTVKVRKTSAEKKELSSSYLPSKCGYSPLRLTTTGDSVNYLGREGDILKSSLPKTTPATGKSDIVRTRLWDNESIKDYDFERENWISNSKMKKTRHLEANQSLYKKMWNKINEVIADKQLEEEKKLKAWKQRLPRVSINHNKFLNLI